MGIFNSFWVFWFSKCRKLLLLFTYFALLFHKIAKIAFKCFSIGSYNVRLFDFHSTQLGSASAIQFRSTYVYVCRIFHIYYTHIYRHLILSCSIFIPPKTICAESAKWRRPTYFLFGMFTHNIHICGIYYIRRLRPIYKNIRMDHTQRFLFCQKLTDNYSQ